MILGKYKEIMDKLEVTEEMKERILKNVQEKFSDHSSMSYRKPSLVQFYRKYIAVAASFFILLASVFLFSNLIKENSSKDPQNLIKEDPSKDPPPIIDEPEYLPGVSGIGGIEEKASIEELSEAVHFDVVDIDISKLPFEVSKRIYESYWGEMAEITYMGENEQLVYRKAVGDEDISGDYNTYTKEKNLIIDDKTITLKGNGKKYNLAIWTYGKFSYSLYYENGLSKKELIKIISRIK